MHVISQRILLMSVSVIVAGAVALLVIVGLMGGVHEVLEYDFSEGEHGWAPGWVDLPADHDPVFYRLESNWSNLPAKVGDAKAIFISSDNHADDVFMFLKKQLTGLGGECTYAITFEIEFASKYPEGSIGIGGSPADSVYIKGGAAKQEPVPIVDTEGWLRLSVDKGTQSQGGEHAVVLGTIAKPDDGTDDYVLINRHNRDEPLVARTDADGGLWVFVGTDSAFEGYTALYYTNVRILLEPQ